MQRNNLFQSLCIPDVHGFHSRNISSSEFTSVRQFLANAEVFSTHSEKFRAQLIVNHIQESNLAPVSFRQWVQPRLLHKGPVAEWTQAGTY